MSELVVLAQLLKKDVEMYHGLLLEAEKNNNLRLMEELAAELAEMKDMLNHIEQPEFQRHLRLVQNEAWREFNDGGRK
jgi:prephenate dehydrogenase